MIRRSAVLVAVSSLASIAFAAPSAHAATSTSCTSTGTATVTPGITLTAANQTVKSKSTLTCTGGGVTSGTATSTIKGVATCTTGTLKGTIKVVWNTKETSTASLTTTSAGAGKVNLSGKVTKGKFVGETVSGQLSFTPTKGNCLSTPATALSFTGTTSL